MADTIKPTSSGTSLVEQEPAFKVGDRVTPTCRCCYGKEGTVIAVHKNCIYNEYTVSLDIYNEYTVSLDCKTEVADYSEAHLELLKHAKEEEPVDLGEYSDW